MNKATARMRPVREAIAELEREMDVRARCFARWVKDGKMTKVDAVDRYERHLSAIMALRELVHKDPNYADQTPAMQGRTDVCDAAGEAEPDLSDVPF